MKNKNELKGRDWRGGLYWKEKVDRRFVLGRKRMDRRQAVVACKQSLGSNRNMQRIFELPMPLLVDDRKPVDEYPKLSQLICSQSFNYYSGFR